MRGTVQGVGFRPFVYRLARRHALAGWVRNSTGPVEMEVEGEPQRLRHFLRELLAEAPPLARIEGLEQRPVVRRGELEFRIEESAPRPGDFQAVAPDAATCED